MSVRSRARSLPTVITVLIAGVFAYNVAAQDISLYGFDPETRIYIVQPGDTLWGISERAYEDPWKWPRIWENNPEVENPHQIYPDGTLVMPYTDGSVPQPPAPAPEPVTQPEPVTEPEIDPEPEPEPEMVEPVEQDGADILSDYGDEAQESRINVQSKPATRRSAGHIVLRIGPEGLFTTEENRQKMVILGGPDERKNFGDHDLVFLSRGENSGLKTGQRFYTYEKREAIRHPETKEDLGAYLRTTGVLEVEKVSRRSSTARVIASFDTISVDQYLTEYRQFESEVIPQYSDQAQEGLILATLENLRAVATNQIIYTDLGARDGIKPGTLMNISRKQRTRYDRINDEDIPLPNMDLGLGVVLEASEKTSTVLIVKSNDAIHVGDSIHTVVDDS